MVIRNELFADVSVVEEHGLSSTSSITRSGIHFNDASFLFRYVTFPSYFSSLKMCIFIVAKFDNC